MSEHTQVRMELPPSEKPNPLSTPPVTTHTTVTTSTCLMQNPKYQAPSAERVQYFQAPQAHCLHQQRSILTYPIPGRLIEPQTQRQYTFIQSVRFSQNSI
ncbi:hypothetical protein AVEN_247928-1 [Araneus ventricosus]|uniref:Uncharacterized protein n=1 Tax=Araneus ventricosus TaxID=182803 RepID=A0A4Y2CI65_ARAVE|nr:hypothetical protein AVEN_247928-1 [Araneus ventricosus]